jgi:hypothetical protein
VATFVYTSSQGQRMHSARTKIDFKLGGGTLKKISPVWSKIKFKQKYGSFYARTDLKPWFQGSKKNAIQFSGSNILTKPL